MSLLSRIFRPSAVKAAEGEYRAGPYLLDGGWLSASAGKWWNWWQLGHNLAPYGAASAMVEASVSAYAQTIAMCPGDHWQTLPDGGRKRVTSSALTRILRRPNDYQTISDFLLNLTRGLYMDGNAYALALRNDRYEVEQLHLMNPRFCSPRLSETGEIFYNLGGNEIIEARFGANLLVPSRDVLHVRLHTPNHPLKGVSPLMAAALDMAAGDAVMRQQIAFFTNQARPSFVLSTDEKLTAEQTAAARDRWNETTRGENAGGTPVLGWGLKPMAIGGTAQDAQLAETLKMTDQHIALAFGMPLQVLGIGGSAPLGSTEALMARWLASGLGFALNHIEEAFGQLFRLRGQPDEYLEFDTRALLRSSFKEKIEGLARGVQGGIYAPDEARAEFDLGSVEGGDQPRVQQQLVPLSYGMNMQPPEATPAPSDEGSADERADTDGIIQRLYDHAGTQLH